MLFIILTSEPGCPLNPGSPLSPFSPFTVFCTDGANCPLSLSTTTFRSDTCAGQKGSEMFGKRLMTFCCRTLSVKYFGVLLKSSGFKSQQVENCLLLVSFVSPPPVKSKRVQGAVLIFTVFLCMSSEVWRFTGILIIDLLCVSHQIYICGAAVVLNCMQIPDMVQFLITCY